MHLDRLYIFVIMVSHGCKGSLVRAALEYSDWVLVLSLLTEGGTPNVTHIVYRNCFVMSPAIRVEVSPRSIRTSSPRIIELQT